MEIRPINTAEDHKAALTGIEALWGAEPGTPRGDRLDVLATLVESYETRNFPLPTADPIAILQFAIRDMGRLQAELAALLGSRSRASEILARRRPLTLEMIRKISAAWRIPAEALIEPYELERDYA